MKMSFKLTMWAMLFIIVVVLALSYFMDTNVSQEGFGSYKHDSQNNSKTKILAYSKTNELVKLYDCLYFDELNGNIIEVVSPEYIDDTETPTGVFTGINVIKRADGSSKQYDIISNTDESGQTIYNARQDGTNVTINDSNATFNETASKSFLYNTMMNVPQYVVFVHANNKETLIHVLDKTNNMFKISFVFEKDGATEFDATSTPYTDGTPTYRVNNKAPVPGWYIKVSDNVVYDNINENVLVSTDANNLLVISSDGSGKETTTNMYSSSENDKTRTNWIYPTTAGNTILYYPSPNGKGVFIGDIESEVIAATDTGSTATGSTDTGSTDTGSTATGSTDTGAESFTQMVDGNTYTMIFKSVYVAYPTETNIVSDNNTVTETVSEITTTQNGALSELEKAFEVMERGKELYGHLFGLDKNSKSGGEYGEDYFLKTEVVPPVCPMCPGCVSGCNGVCNDCGGNGGSGTKGSDGKSITGNNKNAIEKTVDSAGNAIEKTVDSAGNAIEKTVDSAGNVIEKTIDSAGNVVEKTLDSAGNVISEVGAGTKQVAGDVYGAIGTAGTGAKQVAGDVYGAIGTAGTGAKQVAGDVYGATTGVAGDVYGATTGVAGDIYGAATGVIGDLYSGVTNLSGATQLPARQQVGNVSIAPVQNQSQMNMTGTSQMPSYQNSVTNYDYYGALPNKTSNYVARTADFSSF